MVMIRFVSALCIVSALHFVGTPSFAEERETKAATLRTVGIGAVTSELNNSARTTGLSRDRTASSLHSNGIILWVLAPSDGTPDTVPIEIILGNRGNDDFMCGENGYLVDSVVRVRTKQGNEVAYTTHGSNLFGGVSRVRHHHTMVRYGPGRFRHWRYNLADAFAPLSSGHYVLSLQTTVRMRDNETNEWSKNVRLGTDEIPFMITDEEPNGKAGN